MHRVVRCGTSVSGPLNTVREDRREGTVSADTHATLGGPGASIAIRDDGPVEDESDMTILSDVGDQEQSGLGASSGTAAVMADRDLDCDASREAEASAADTAFRRREEEKVDEEEEAVFVVVEDDDVVDTLRPPTIPRGENARVPPPAPA